MVLPFILFGKAFYCYYLNLKIATSERSNQGDKTQGKTSCRESYVTLAINCLFLALGLANLKFEAHLSKY